MCPGCGDFVTYCAQDECFKPDSGSHGKIRQFYVDDTYCRHLQEYYGHEVATWADKDKEYEEDDE